MTERPPHMMINHKHTRFGPIVLWCTAPCQKSTQHTNRFYSNIQRSDGKSFEIKVSSEWSTADDKEATVIVDFRKKTKPSLMSTGVFLVCHGSCFVFYILDHPPCLCHLAFWLATHHIQQSVRSFVLRDHHTLWYRTKRTQYINILYSRYERSWRPSEPTRSLLTRQKYLEPSR